MRSRVVVFAILALGLNALPSLASATLLIKVDKSTQMLTVARDGQVLHTWRVSTGKTGYATPSGNFTAFRMEADHFSKEWDDAPMPHSVFFTKQGHAIHGSFDVKRLGSPASHGCVRLAPANAAVLFALVKQEGLPNTQVVLTGSEQVALERMKANRTARGPRRTLVGHAEAPTYAYPAPEQPRYVNPNYPPPQHASQGSTDIALTALRSASLMTGTVHPMRRAAITTLVTQILMMRGRDTPHATTVEASITTELSVGAVTAKGETRWLEIVASSAQQKIATMNPFRECPQAMGDELRPPCLHLPAVDPFPIAAA